MTLLFKDIKIIHGDSVNKGLTFECTSKAEITMKTITHKDYSNIVSNIKVEDLQTLMAQFTKTTILFNSIKSTTIQKRIFYQTVEISLKNF